MMPPSERNNPRPGRIPVEVQGGGVSIQSGSRGNVRNLNRPANSNRATEADTGANVRSIDEWRKIAQENRASYNNSVNPHTAARLESQRSGKDSVIVHSDGTRYIYRNGRKIDVDANVELPKPMESILDAYAKGYAKSSDVQKVFKDNGWQINLRPKSGIEVTTPKGKVHFIPNAHF
jgi:hypothetical protein